MYAHNCKPRVYSTALYGTGLNNDSRKMRKREIESLEIEEGGDERRMKEERAR